MGIDTANIQSVSTYGFFAVKASFAENILLDKNKGRLFYSLIESYKSPPVHSLENLFSFTRLDLFFYSEDKELSDVYHVLYKGDVTFLVDRDSLLEEDTFIDERWYKFLGIYRFYTGFSFCNQPLSIRSVCRRPFLCSRYYHMLLTDSRSPVKDQVYEERKRLVFSHLNKLSVYFGLGETKQMW